MYTRDKAKDMEQLIQNMQPWYNDLIAIGEFAQQDFKFHTVMSGI